MVHTAPCPVLAVKGPVQKAPAEPNSAARRFLGGRMNRLACVFAVGLLGFAGISTAAAQPLAASDLRAAHAR